MSIDKTDNKWQRYIIYAAFIACLVFIIFVRVRLLDIPLERDEGEYAYFGQLMLEGIVPFERAYNMKFPGTGFIYAINMALFGQTISGIHLGFMCWNILTIVLIFYLCLRWLNLHVALMTACSYGLMSLSSNVFGFAAHATHFVTVFFILSLICTLHAIQKQSLLWTFLAGCLGGMSLLMKQHAIFLLIFITLIFFYQVLKPRKGLRKNQLKPFGIFILGSITPFTSMIILFSIAGTFKTFWFWTMDYASSYASSVSMKNIWSNFSFSFKYVSSDFQLFWILAGIGLILLPLHRDLRGKKGLIILFSICSFATICPGFYFRPHYFITLLPAVCLLAAIAIDTINSWLRQFNKHSLQWISYIFFVVVFAMPIYTMNNYLFKIEPHQLSRQVYSNNPFIESINVAEYIKANSTPEDTMAIMGSEPQICFYAQRKKASGFLYVYNLMEQHPYALDMQKQMIREIEEAKPKYFITVKHPNSWLMGKNSENHILKWMPVYANKHYNVIGIVDILKEGSIYKWDESVKTYKPKSTLQIITLKRK